MDIDKIQFDWSELKSKWLKNNRGASFDELLGSRHIDIEDHPRVSHQRFHIFEYREYVWVVPYVMVGDIHFLKTAYPSRKHTDKYLRKEK